eukprot:CAMPEP_0172194050 /NCGR_PEP_ID=MMETSP1050-20130122/25338_1 /TAXON_ID=233186 /ORGANISM="Cryptomonas curvata, Strain CCAP979/52" /LENGTH=45 /DNA_ID= /DNA_START= /DNA_END= /DNA_ORIENTATION=
MHRCVAARIAGETSPSSSLPVPVHWSNSGKKVVNQRSYSGQTAVK